MTFAPPAPDEIEEAPSSFVPPSPDDIETTNAPAAPSAYQFAPPPAAPATPAPTSTTATGAFTRQAAENILPAYGALAGAKVAGSQVVKKAATGAVGRFLGGLGLGEAIGLGPEDPLADVLGVGLGLVGAIIGSTVADKAQHEALKVAAPQVADELEQFQQEDLKDHPVASFAGSLFGSLPAFKLANPIQTATAANAIRKIAAGQPVTAIEKRLATNLAVQAGLGAGMGVVNPLLQGQKPTGGEITQSVAQFLLFGEPRKFGKSSPPGGGGTTTGDQNALDQPETTGLPVRNEGEGVGETAPLRQQGEAAPIPPLEEVQTPPVVAPREEVGSTFADIGRVAAMTPEQFAAAFPPEPVKPAAKPTAPAISPEIVPALKSKLFENMQGREMFIPATEVEQQTPHLKLVLGRNTPTWRQLSDAGIVDVSTPNEKGMVSVKVKQTSPTIQPAVVKTPPAPTGSEIIPPKPEQTAISPQLAKPTLAPEQHWLFDSKAGDVQTTPNGGNVIVIKHFDKLKDANELSAALFNATSGKVDAKVEPWIKKPTKPGAKGINQYTVYARNVSDTVAQSIRDAQAPKPESGQPKPVQPEIVQEPVSAAVRAKSGELVTGNSHDEIYGKGAKKGEEGFILPSGEFIPRKEAAKRFAGRQHSHEFGFGKPLGELYESARENLGASPREFEKAFAKDADAGVKESKSEFLKRMFCSGKFPTKRSVLSE